MDVALVSMETLAKKRLILSMETVCN